MIRCLRFCFTPTPEIDALLSKVQSMEQEAVNWLIDNNTTTLSSVHSALYRTFRSRFPQLHSQWITSALKSARNIVRRFQKHPRKEETRKPNLKRASVTLSPHLLKEVHFDGERLKIVILKCPRDNEPIMLEFRPHHKYGELLSKWVAGECKMGQVTLTHTTISIPLKFQAPEPYQPKTVIGVDSNEMSLDYYNMKDGSWGSIDISKVALISEDYDRRISMATKCKNNPKAKAKIQRKYGGLKKKRVTSEWHRIALMLVQMALENRAALVLEDLKGLKSSIRKRISQRMRQRLLNRWSIVMFHRILKEKCKQHGVPYVVVDPSGTSRFCPKCRGSLKKREQKCPSCGLSRHYVAAMNIAHRGMKKFPDLEKSGQGSVGDPRRPSSASAK